MKTNKSYTKRIRVSKPKKGGVKTPKLVISKPGGSHLNSSKSGQQQLRRKAAQKITIKEKTRKRFMPHA